MSCGWSLSNIQNSPHYAHHTNGSMQIYHKSLLKISDREVCELTSGVLSMKAWFLVFRCVASLWFTLSLTHLLIDWLIQRLTLPSGCHVIAIRKHGIGFYSPLFFWHSSSAPFNTSPLYSYYPYYSTHHRFFWFISTKMLCSS